MLKYHECAAHFVLGLNNGFQRAGEKQRLNDLTKVKQ